MAKRADMVSYLAGTQDYGSWSREEYGELLELTLRLKLRTGGAALAANLF